MSNRKAPILIAFLAVSISNSLRAEFFERGRQMMILHRTANRDLPENTLEALEESALLGADIVEIDIRRTLDGELVLLHDGPIDRVSTGTGDVEQMLAAEFALYDAGAWMNPRFAGMRHPTLEDALRISRRLGLKLNLDLKSKGITRQVYDMAKAEGMLDRVRFGGNAGDIQDIDPNMNSQKTTSWHPGMTEAEIDALQAKGLFVVASFSANLHEQDLPLMHEAVAAGVDAINTDHPRLAADALGRSIEAKALALREQVERGTGVERAKSLLELARYRDFELLDYFTDKLRDADPTVSRAAAVALVQRARPETVESILSVSEHPSSPTHLKANQAWTIGMLPQQVNQNARRFLQACLNSEHSNTKVEALLAITKAPGTFPINPIAKRVYDASGLVSGAAVLALAKHDPAKAERLIPTLAKRLRKEIEATWTQYGEPIEYENPLAKSRTTFERPFDPAISNQENLLARAVDLYSGYQKTLAAAASIETTVSTNWLHEELERFAHDFSNFVSYIAAFQLWDRGDPERLVESLKATHPFVRDRAQWTLVKSGSNAAPALRQALKSSDRNTRLRAAQTMAWIGDTSMLPLLEKLKNQDDNDAQTYAWAIAKIQQIQRLTALSPGPSR